jgi:hypothetical protein
MMIQDILDSCRRYLLVVSVGMMLATSLVPGGSDFMAATVAIYGGFDIALKQLPDFGPHEP